MPLVRALTQSEQIKNKVEECAHELSSVNEMLKHEVAAPVPLEQVEQALQKSEDVELKVQECADDLSQVNHELAGEIRQRKKLERKLTASKAELADTQAELSNSQIEGRRARHLALHDFVTGLPNRTLLNDRLNTALALAKRHSWLLAVMFIDLDKFKNINDTHGHGAGDKVIKIVSDRLQASVRGADTVGRQGGDEFVYLMVEVKNEDDVANAARTLIEHIAQPCEFDGLSLSVEPSIGIALYPKDGSTANDLLKNADLAMYAAKQNKTRYSFFNV